jgi:hypothetical protein
MIAAIIVPGEPWGRRAFGAPHSSPITAPEQEPLSNGWKRPDGGCRFQPYRHPVQTRRRPRSPAFARTNGLTFSVWELSRSKTE